MLLGAGVAGETRGRRISRGELHYVKSTNGVVPSNSDLKDSREIEYRGAVKSGGYYVVG